MEAVDMSEAELCDFREGEELEMSVDSSDTAELYASSLGAGGGSDIGRGSNGVHVQGPTAERPTAERGRCALEVDSSMNWP